MIEAIIEAETILDKGLMIEIEEDTINAEAKQEVITFQERVTQKTRQL